MIVLERNTIGDAEPAWDTVAIHGCDFRPHFDGHLYNVYTTIQPLSSRSATVDLFRHVALQIATWTLDNWSRFGAHDRIQIIVGWPLCVRATGRQCVKVGGDLAALKRLVASPESITTRDGWDNGLTRLNAEAAQWNLLDESS